MTKDLVSAENLFKNVYPLKFIDNCIFQFLSKVFEHNKRSHPEVFLVKGILKICRKFPGQRSCRSAISIKLLFNFIEITLRHGCSVNLLNTFRTPFTKNISGWLLLA